MCVIISQLPLKNMIGLFDMYSSLGFLCDKNVMGISEIPIKIDEQKLESDWEVYKYDNKIASFVRLL